MILLVNSFFLHVKMITTFDENYIASAYDEDLNLGTEFFDLGDCYNILFCA